MSEEKPRSEEPTAEPPIELPEETVDGLPVVAEFRALERAPARPGAQMAAAAATGFVAGAATLVLVRRRGTRRAIRAAVRRSARMNDLQIASSHTFLVDVHVLSRPLD